MYRLKREYSCLLVAIISFILCMGSSIAFEWETTCIDDISLKNSMNFTSCNATMCESYNISQYSTCEFGCDNVTNQCKYELTSGNSYLAIPLVFCFLTAIFFFLGMKIQPGKEFSMFKNGLQTLFFMLGLWFLLLDLGLINSVAMASGVSQSTMSYISTAIIIMTYIIYIVMILFMLSFLVVVLMMMMPKKKKPFGR